MMPTNSSPLDSTVVDPIIDFLPAPRTPPVRPGAWTMAQVGDGPAPGINVIPLPDCVVGRSGDAGLRIADSSISKIHARLSGHQGSLFVEDLGSTNGTYVNQTRIESSILVPGDLLQFANIVFRINQGTEEEAMCGTKEVGPSLFAGTLLLFERLINQRCVTPFYQPIISMDREIDWVPVGTELLARSDLEELRNPAAMFAIAERLGQQAALSEMMREVGSRAVLGHPLAQLKLFYNTHGDEFGTARLTSSLRSLREQFPTLQLVIEIHEAAVTSQHQMHDFRELLKELDMQLAYDDFGAGQGRLIELTEVPADYLKFDMSLIRNINSAGRSRQELLASLVRASIESGSVPLAEGVETAAEHATCRQMGFQLGQGYYYGRPAALKSS